MESNLLCIFLFRRKFKYFIFTMYLLIDSKKIVNYILSIFLNKIIINFELSFCGENNFYVIFL